MTDRSLQRKLIAGVFGICLLAILTSATSLFVSRILIADMANVATGEGLDLADARSLQLSGVKNIGNVEACLLSGGREFAPAARAGGALVRDIATRMRLRSADAQNSQLIDAVLSAEAAHEDAFAKALATRASVRMGFDGFGTKPDGTPFASSCATYWRE